MSPIKILVADDDPEIRILYGLVLQEHYNVVFARDGVEAWTLFNEHRPRLVVTDLNMPGMNGQQLTEKIRNHEELGETPVIILTGTTVGSDLAPGFWRIGTRASSFLEKPVLPKELIQEIRRQLVKVMQQAGPLPAGTGDYGFGPVVAK